MKNDGLDLASRAGLGRLRMPLRRLLQDPAAPLRRRSVWPLMAKSDEQRAAEERLRQARDELERVSRQERAKGIDYETPDYWRANKAVVEAEKSVPWWRR